VVAGIQLATTRASSRIDQLTRPDSRPGQSTVRLIIACSLLQSGGWGIPHVFRRYRFGIRHLFGLIWDFGIAEYVVFGQRPAVITAEERPGRYRIDRIRHLPHEIRSDFYFFGLTSGVRVLSRTCVMRRALSWVLRLVQISEVGACGEFLYMDDSKRSNF